MASLEEIKKKERERVRAGIYSSVRTWNKNNPDQKISGVMPKEYTAPTEYKRSVTSTGEGGDKTASTFKSGSKGASSAAKSAMEAAQKQQAAAATAR